MADLYGFAGALGRELWLARNWASMGTSSAPHEGAVIVWAHHVGQLVRHVAGDVWIVLSGNDGHRVRERPRHIGHYIAIRDVPHHNAAVPIQVAAFFARA